MLHSTYCTKADIHNYTPISTHSASNLLLTGQLSAWRNEQHWSEDVEGQQAHVQVLVELHWGKQGHAAVSKALYFSDNNKIGKVKVMLTSLLICWTAPRRCVCVCARDTVSACVCLQENDFTFDFVFLKAKDTLFLSLMESNHARRSVVLV